MLHAFLAAFTGTAVEFFETAVIAYAIARAGYVREALSALVLGHVLVFALAVLLVPMQGALPVTWLRLAAALMLVAMGLHWTQKSLRRWLAHQRPRWAEDPLAAVALPTAAPSAQGSVGATTMLAFSGLVFVAMLKSSVIEAVEILIVVFPVAAATSAWGPVLVGVAGGILAVGVVTLLLHGQLRRVPEVLLKLWTGVLLLALGLWWLIELALEP